MSVTIVWESNNENSVVSYVHTDNLLSLVPVYSIHRHMHESEFLGASLLQTLLGIHGVQDARVDRYKVRIERTKAVEWNSICPEVDKAITNYTANYVRSSHN